MALTNLYQRSCTKNAIFFGVGATVNSSGAVVNRGRANNSLVVELKGWVSIRLSTMVFSIVAQELVG